MSIKKKIKRIRADSRRQICRWLIGIACGLKCISSIFFVAYADEAEEINAVLKGIITDVINPIFVSIGVILTVYSIGQLVLAFKNEDADSKSRASSQMAVGILLIAMPSVIQGLGILSF